MKKPDLSAGFEETGSASVTQLGVIFLMLVCALALAAGGYRYQLQQRLQVKADIIALGSAEVLAENFGVEKVADLACQEAKVLAERNQVELAQCVASKTEIWVLIREVVYDFGVISFSHAGIGTEFEH